VVDVPSRTPPVEPSPAPVPTAEPSGAYANPVFGESFPDPMVIRDDHAYWAFGTGDRFPILRSPDLVHWRAAGHALAARASSSSTSR
jgi:beta-xylosidase